MKFSAIFTSALAAVAYAAPTTSEPAAEIEARNVDISGLNGLSGFQHVDLNYLQRLNSIDLNVLNQLGQVNGLNLGAFQHVFNVQVFDLNALLQLQQINMLVVLQQQGLFNQFNLAQLNLGVLDLGLIQNIHQVNLGQFVSNGNKGQIQQIAGQPTNLILS